MNIAKSRLVNVFAVEAVDFFYNLPTFRFFDTMGHREMPSFVGFKIVFFVCVASEDHLIPGSNV